MKRIVYILTWFSLLLCCTVAGNNVLAGISRAGQTVSDTQVQKHKAVLQDAGIVYSDHDNVLNLAEADDADPDAPASPVHLLIKDIFQQIAALCSVQHSGVQQPERIFALTAALQSIPRYILFHSLIIPFRN